MHFKSYSVLFLVWTFAVPTWTAIVQGKLNPVDLKNKFTSRFGSCHIEKLSHDDRVAILTDQTPSHEGKCYLACILDSLELLNDDGQFRVNGYKNLLVTYENLLETVYNNTNHKTAPDSQCFNGTILQKCIGLAKKDRCATAYQTYQCIGQCALLI